MFFTKLLVYSLHALGKVLANFVGLVISTRKDHIHYRQSQIDGIAVPMDKGFFVLFMCHLHK